VTERRTALAVVLAGAAVFVLVAAQTVPWDPVPGGALSAPDAGRYFTAAEIARGEDFSLWARVWGWSSLLVSLLVLGILGFTRAGRGLVDRLPGRWWVQVPLAVAAVEVIARVVTLPFAVALRRHVLDYGLSNQAWAAYAVDLVKSEALDVAVTSLVMLVLVGTARRWPRAWPAVAGAALAVLVLLGSLVYPLLVEPLFNSFTPLADGPLRTRILDLAEQEGVDVDDVLVADASRRTTTLNAYVSGFGGTRRVVVYDNLLEELTPAQARLVIAHELGHAKNRDVVTGTALAGVGAVAGVALLALLLDSGRLRRRTGTSGPTDPSAVFLVLALVAVGSFVVSPVQNTVSRAFEARADRVSIQATGADATFVQMQRRLALTSLADPSPPWLSQLWFGSHPTVLQRAGLPESLREAER